MHAKERVLDEYTKDDWCRLVFCIDALKEDVIAQWKVCHHWSTCRAKFMFRLEGASVVVPRVVVSCQDVPKRPTSVPTEFRQRQVCKLCNQPSAYQCALAVVSYAIAEKPRNTWKFSKSYLRFYFSHNFSF